MSCCAPACAVPTCVPTCSPSVCYPVGGLGSLTSCGAGSYGSYGLGSAGGGLTAASLGLAHGAKLSCVSQTPPSEVYIQPAPVSVIIPGPILASTCEPIRDHPNEIHDLSDLVQRKGDNLEEQRKVFLSRLSSIFLKMSCCAPSCAVPICVPASSPPVCYPVDGLGSLTSCGVGGTYGLDSAGSGGAVPAASLGMTSRSNVSCVNQIPPSEILIQPPPFNIVIPGAILAATSDLVRVGGYTACATGSSSGAGSRHRYYPCSPCKY
ncbi:keratin-associated protein 9-1-like [Crotalus adamanteus]|uniref:Keratin-associated protein 9-1-like n=1 Tax=Crotalus adamanteus TaxID=8729 RepID=A0AAW1AM38_CROAD